MLFVSIVISINTFIISHNFSFPPLCEYAYLNTWFLWTLYSIRYAAVWRGVVLFLHLKHDREYSIGHFRIPWQMCTLLLSYQVHVQNTKKQNVLALHAASFWLPVLLRQFFYHESLPIKDNRETRVCLWNVFSSRLWIVHV